MTKRKRRIDLGDREGAELMDNLLTIAPVRRKAELERLRTGEQQAMARHWKLFARPEQLPPPGEWHTWLVMAGRGFGKTRAGAEWVRSIARNDGTARIALVGSSFGDARAVMVEGDSGILAVCDPKRRPVWEPSIRRLTWPNGAVATLYSALEPELLRGPQHSHARRPGAKGSIRQRSPCVDRRAPPLRRRSSGFCAAFGSGRWPGMDRRPGRVGSLDRP